MVKTKQEVDVKEELSRGYVADRGELQKLRRQIFHPGILFPFLMVSFAVQELINLIRPLLFIFAFILLPWETDLRKEYFLNKKKTVKSHSLNIVMVKKIFFTDFYFF